MAKDEPGISSKSSRLQSDRTVPSPPNVEKSHTPKDRRIGKHRPSPDAGICAAGEKSQLEFQRIVGSNLKAARLKSHLKQSDVAAVTGLTQQYLSLIEAGQQNVALKTLILLAKVAGHDLLDFLKQVAKHSAEAE